MAEKMDKCPKCGKETQGGGYCTACGVALPDGTTNESKLLKSAEANEKTVQFCRKWSKVSLILAFGIPLLLTLCELDTIRFNSKAMYMSFLESFMYELELNALYPLPFFAALFCFLMFSAKQMQKTKLSVFTDHVSFSCPQKVFQVQQIELKYSDITNSAVSSSFRAQNECVVLTSGGKSYSIPVEEADTMCQLIKKQTDTLQ